MTKPRDRFERFRAWLLQNGAEIMLPTNEWEMVRFRAESRTSIVYTSKAGNVTFTGEARAAYDAFESGKAYRFAPRVSRKRSTPVLIQTLLDRDGPRCFYCAADFETVKPTKEHLVPITAGGPDHIGNLFLACQPCNEEVGHKSAAEKIRFRDLKRRGIGMALLMGTRDHLQSLVDYPPHEGGPGDEIREIITEIEKFTHHPKKESENV